METPEQTNLPHLPVVRTCSTITHGTQDLTVTADDYVAGFRVYYTALSPVILGGALSTD